MYVFFFFCFGFCLFFRHAKVLFILFYKRERKVPMDAFYIPVLIFLVIQMH